jgi:hypothetical protein
MISPGFYPGQVLDPVDVFSHGQDSFWPYLSDQLNVLHYGSVKKVAHEYTEIKLPKSSGTRETMFRAVSQLMNYADYSIERWRELISSNMWDRRMVFLFLAIAFDGLLYEAEVLDGRLSLFPRDVLLLEQARPSKANGRATHYLIDVVTRKSFPEYVETLNQDVTRLRSVVKSNLASLFPKLEESVLGWISRSEKARRTRPPSD